MPAGPPPLPPRPPGETSRPTPPLPPPLQPSHGEEDEGKDLMNSNHRDS